MMNLRADSFVFIIHGEPDVRQTLSELLLSAGLQVDTFASGEEFLAAHDPEKPGCVLLGLHFPLQMSGLEILRSLAKFAPPRAALVLAGQTTVEEVIEAFRTGASDFFVQPIQPDLLIKHIRSAIASDISRRRHYAHWLDVQSRMAKLTPVELEVVQLLADGLLNKQIAARLNVAVRTIELRRANIFRKMEVSSLGDLLRLVIFLDIYSQGSLND
jgi:FixJ family two-component response regulator